MCSLTDVGENVLDISKHNTDNQILLGGHTPCCIHVRELDWFKPIKGNLNKIGILRCHSEII